MPSKPFATAAGSLRGPGPSGLVDLVLALAALAALAMAGTQLFGATRGLEVRHVAIGETPATVYRPADAAVGPAVLVAHGFAGSQQLMQPIAITLARAGYVAVTFDFLGHGRHPQPLTGSITETTGATARLVAQIERVADFARGEGDGRLAVVGHSMASDLVVRFAQATPDVAATVAIAMFAPTVTARTPANLLVVVGDWEPRLKTEALNAVALVADGEPEPGVIYGDLADGTARKAVFAEHVEHVGVLYSRDTLVATTEWLNRVFEREGPVSPDLRGGAIGLLLFGLVALARPLLHRLPEAAPAPIGAGLTWRGFWLPAILPALTTPILLWLVPFQLLPILVADYLVAHFALYGLLTALTLAWLQRGASPAALGIGAGRALAGAVVLACYSVLVFGLPLDRFVVAFMPTAERAPYLLLMLLGTLPFFLVDEWLTRGGRSGLYAASKVMFVLSLALAVALDVERLFFLLLITPVIALFFLIYGLFSGWAYQRTRQPLVGGIANAVAFAWAIAVTFPLVAG